MLIVMFASRRHLIWLTILSLAVLSVGLLIAA
jgi:hypothetical protein